jgi:hypothetical protein
LQENGIVFMNFYGICYGKLQQLNLEFLLQKKNQHDILIVQKSDFNFMKDVRRFLCHRMTRIEQKICRKFFYFYKVN